MITTVANLGAITVIGFIYVAYIKNLKAMNSLKEEQLKVSEKNVKLWKDRALELERKSPEFIEKQLSERIKIREEEILRLKSDTDEHNEAISQKNLEIQELKKAINKAFLYRKSISIWDSEKRDFIEIADSDLDQEYVGSIFVDSARLMICDPFHLKIRDEQEKENFQVLPKKYKVVDTGEVFCTDTNDLSNVELLGIANNIAPEELLSQGILEEVKYSGDLPAIKSTYIKGDFIDPNFVYRQVNHYSFLNGSLGAGISVSLPGDGFYPVSLETYKGVVQRIIIDV